MPRKTKRDEEFEESFEDEKFSESYLSMGLGLLVVLVVGVLLYNFFMSRNKSTSEIGEEGAAEGQEATQSANVPDTHTISEGETLWDISEKYYGSGFEWGEIANENGIINPNLVEAGQQLNLPKVQKTLPETGISDDGLIVPETYVVQEGDTLWSVACNLYGDCYRWTEIAAANNLDNPEVIFPGSQLQLP